MENDIKIQNLLDNLNRASSEIKKKTYLGALGSLIGISALSFFTFPLGALSLLSGTGVALVLLKSLFEKLKIEYTENHIEKLKKQISENKEVEAKFNILMLRNDIPGLIDFTYEILSDQVEAEH
jgi:hypothetical protein